MGGSLNDTDCRDSERLLLTLAASPPALDPDTEPEDLRLDRRE
jgi:hypothetical protein